ncbi:MAG TPA: AgmX/PglI C-terminal domain-containing protein [Kofleriaceae bacterium]|jgi:hypothetical protein|nr:AgmX/PglI C-terminal domain-containing protein [Kofleriaceae bacterium]
MRLVTLATAVALLVPAAAGCKKSGLGPTVRTDVTARMQSAEGPITACYSAALERNRKLRGTLVLTFVAAAGTGQFEQINVKEGLPDPDLTNCVVAEVGKLKLETPQKTAQAIEYPIRFQPNK